MALRLIEIYHQRGKSEEIDFLLKDSPLLDIWHDKLPEGETITKVLLKVENTENVLDILQDYFSKEHMRVVILPVEATLPSVLLQGFSNNSATCWSFSKGV